MFTKTVEVNYNHCIPNFFLQNVAAVISKFLLNVTIKTTSLLMQCCDSAVHNCKSLSNSGNHLGALLDFHRKMNEWIVALFLGSWITSPAVEIVKKCIVAYKLVSLLWKDGIWNLCSFVLKTEFKSKHQGTRCCFNLNDAFFGTKQSMLCKPALAWL